MWIECSILWVWKEIIYVNCLADCLGHWKVWKWKLVAQSCLTLQPYGARQAPLSMEFSRQEYWSGLPFPSPGHLPNSDWTQVFCIEDRFFTVWTFSAPIYIYMYIYTYIFICVYSFYIKCVGFLHGTSGKEPASQCRKHKRHRFDPWVGKISWSRAL